MPAQLNYRHVPSAPEKTTATLESWGSFGASPIPPQPRQGDAGASCLQWATLIITLPTLFSLKHALFVTSAKVKGEAKAVPGCQGSTHYSSQVQLNPLGYFCQHQAPRTKAQHYGDLIKYACSKNKKCVYFLLMTWGNKKTLQHTKFICHQLRAFECAISSLRRQKSLSVLPFQDLANSIILLLETESRDVCIWEHQHTQKPPNP